MNLNNKFLYAIKHNSRWQRFVTNVLFGLTSFPMLLGINLLFPSKANATANITIQPISWHIIGLDSNKVTDGPDTFNIGARVCNVGTSDATNVQARFVFDNSNQYINLTGSDTLTLDSLPAGATSHPPGNTGAVPNNCRDFYFNVVVTRNRQAYDESRLYRIEATADGLGTISTPSNRELYVEKLVSQNRNSVLTFDGPTVVEQGKTYTYTVSGETAPGGYEQLVFATNFPNTFFEILSVNTTYTTPSGTSNNANYGDGCGWDPNIGQTPPRGTYRSCVGPVNYGTDGKVGGDFTTIYQVKIIGTGYATVTNLVYDFSGSSYHYNSDYGTGINTKTITAVEATSPDLTISKTDNSIDFNAGSTGSYSFTVNNTGNAATDGTITVTDSLPTGLSVADGSLTVTGANAADWTCTASGNTITCTSSTVIPISGSSTFSFDVNVDNNAPASVTNNVSVSGGGEPEANNGNNTGSDTTNIILPTTSGPTFICDGQFWLAQIPSGGDANQDPSELSIVDTNNKVLNLQFKLDNPSNVFANAIGLNVQDGYMYGIDRKNQLTDRDNEDVIRIAADGTHTNLGNPYGIGSAAGDVSPDGIYYIFNSKKLYKFNVIGLNNATSAGIINIQNNSSIPGFLDIAFNPFDGNIYATHQTDNQIYIINPDDGSWRSLTAPGLNLTGATGAMYFDPFGNFYAYQNSNGDLYKIVFDNPANPQSATAEIFVANPPDVSKNDGTACPFQPKIEKTVDPQTTPAGQNVTYTYRLTNPNGYPITTKLTDTMPSTDGRTFITVVSNSLGGTETISGDKKTLEITGLTLPGKAVNTIAVTVNVPANTPATTPTSPILNQANLSGLPAIFGGTVLSDYPDDPGFSDPTPLQVTTPIASNPSVLLVKRITAINGNSTNNPNDNTPLNTFVDDTTSSKKDDDNHPNWPSNYLIGAIDGGKIKPGEEVEYTIYFLSTGDNTASNVLMCDLVPDNLTFLPGAYNVSPTAATATLTNADRGIVHSYNSNTVSISGIQDSDIGQYFPPGVEPSTVYANIDCDGDPNTNVPNTNGAVVVNLGDLPHAATPGQSNSYGFVRFRGKVK